MNNIFVKGLHTDTTPGRYHKLYLKFYIKLPLELTINDKVRDPDCGQFRPNEQYFYFIDNSFGSLRVDVNRTQGQWKIFHMNSSSMGEDSLLYVDTLPASGEEFFTIITK